MRSRCAGLSLRIPARHQSTKPLPKRRLKLGFTWFFEQLSVVIEGSPKNTDTLYPHTVHPPNANAAKLKPLSASETATSHEVQMHLLHFVTGVSWERLAWGHFGTIELSCNYILQHLHGETQ